MDIEEKVLLKIKSLLDSMQGKFDYIIWGGSGGIKYIKNPHDVDIFVVCSNIEKRDACRELLGKEDMRKDYGIDMHIITVEDDNYFYYVNQIWKDIGNIPEDFINMFEQYMLPSITLDEFLDKKDTIMSIFKACVDRRKEKLLISEDRFYLSKFWYYMYMILTIFKSKSFELSEEEIKNINMLHDRNPFKLEERKELVNELVKEVELWEN